MYPASDTVKQLYADEQRQVLRITGTDKNGAAISITDADIMLNGFSIDRYSCMGNRLQVGTAVASEMSLKLNNSDGKYNNIVFENAELFAEIGIRNWDGHSSTYMTQGAGGTSAGITFSVEPDGRLKLYGTTTSVCRILCLNGQNSFANASTPFNQTFPAGTYNMYMTINGYYTGSIRWTYTLSTFSASEVDAVSTSSPAGTITFPRPAMLGLRIPSGRDLGTVDNPTYVTLTDGNYDLEWMPCGYFTPDEQPRARDLITLSALDRMMRFDITPFDATDLTFPTTVAALVTQVAALCNVPFSQNISSLPNASFTIPSLPDSTQGITYRNLIQWCAGLMATNAFIDWDGTLRFQWYDSPSGSVYVSSPNNRYSSDNQEADITITGISYTDSNNVVHLSGSNGYTIDMSDNILIASNIDVAISAVSAILRGFRYRPYEAQVVNAPYLWPMDMIYFQPVQGGTNILTIVTNVNFGINGKMALAGKGETAKVVSYQTPSSFTPDQQAQINRMQQLSSEAIETAVDNATTQITGATDSHVRFIYDSNGGLQEIVVMDTDDITTATKVWRWNSGGLGFSSNGYAGPYTTAITQDGQIVANFITAGVLNANLIKAGIISDVQNKNSWNLTTGAITMQDGSINIGSGAFTVDTNGDMHAGNAELSGSIKSTNNDGRFVHIHLGGIDGGNSANPNIGSVVFDDLTSLLDTQTVPEKGALISGDVIWLNAHDKIRVGANKDAYGYTGVIRAVYKIDSNGGYHYNNLSFYNGILINGSYINP